METLYIIDAANYLFRAYYAIGPMYNHNGLATSALYGFIRSIQKLEKDFDCKNIVIVFDGPNNKKNRTDLYSEYKKNRQKAPDDFYKQIDLAIDYCNMKGLANLSYPNVEADDTMASITLWAKNKFNKIFLCTSDKDLFQLIEDEKVEVLNVAKNNQIINSKYVKNKFDIPPSQILDLLSIMGDTSDNIPGIKGFGPKTASSLLKKYQSLEGIYLNIDKIDEKKQNILKNEKEKAFLSKKLASLDTKLKIPTKIDFYKIQEEKEDELNNFYQEMNFQTLLTKPEKEKTFANVSTTNYILVNTEKDFQSLIKKLKDAKEICLDVETTSTNINIAKLIGIGLGINKSYYIPLNGTLDLKTITKALKPILENKNIGIYGHNIKYDYEILLLTTGIDIKNICFDTMLASYLLTPDYQKHNLEKLALKDLDIKKQSFDSLTSKNTKNIEDIEIEQVKNYCCSDVDITRQLKENYQKKIIENDLDGVLKEIEVPLIKVLAKMELKGIYIDTKILEKLSTDFTEKLNELEQQIFKETKKKFNINSPKQLSEILYTNLKLPLPSRQKTQYSTSSKILEKLKKKSSIVEQIINYKTIYKLLSSYINSLPKQIDKNTHRIHANFNQSIASTGRLACQNPNLQNIPLHSEEGAKIRQAFMPQQKDFSFLSADYSQIELRLLAHFSEDAQLINAFKKGEDIHAYTASLIFDIPIENINKQHRHIAKGVNFGILYGQSAYGLSQSLNISTKEASDLIKKYFTRYPNISTFIENSKTFSKETLITKTLFGRKRYIPEINNKNTFVRSAAERLAINTPLQGTAADLIKLAMIKIDSLIEKNKFKSFMIMQIHDELIFEMENDETKKFTFLVKNAMETIYKLKVPLLVNIKIGKNWREC